MWNLTNPQRTNNMFHKKKWILIRVGSFLLSLLSNNLKSFEPSIPQTQKEIFVNSDFVPQYQCATETLNKISWETEVTVFLVKSTQIDFSAHKLDPQNLHLLN